MVKLPVFTKSPTSFSPRATAPLSYTTIILHSFHIMSPLPSTAACFTGYTPLQVSHNFRILFSSATNIFLFYSFARHFRSRHKSRFDINPLNVELNPICYLLELLAHHFLHVSRIRVKLLTFRLLMSYIYGAPILDVSRSHTTTQHSR